MITFSKDTAKKEMKSLKKDLLTFVEQKIQSCNVYKELPVYFKFIKEYLENFFLSQRSLTNFKRIWESEHFLHQYLQDEAIFKIYFDVTLKVAAFSNYLTDIVVRNPTYLEWCLTTENLQKPFNEEILSDEIEKTISLFRTLEKKVNALIRFKRREMLRIGLRDILRIAVIEDVIGEYSLLTKVILRKCIDLTFEAAKEKFEIKILSTNYCLIALGKLGGNELNYSSDVDLIFFYGKESDIKTNLTQSEFFEYALTTFIDITSGQREEGYLYRTDFRLRPDGKFSPLARSLDYYLLYYESRGSDWERQMLLKENLICGSEDLYKFFKNRIQNFIYPKSLFETPQEIIVRFKNQYLSRTDTEKNVKHFRGGIRDIEFSIQALQLLNGGKFSTIRTPNTLLAIEALKSEHFIKKTITKKLINAYKFFRKIENYLQLMDDRQTHLIPSNIESLKNLIFFLGYKKKTDFNNALNMHRSNVIKFCESVIGREKVKVDLFEKINFENKKNTFTNLQRLQYGRTITGEIIFDKNIQERFEKIKMPLFEYLRKSSLSDKTLSNLTKLVCSTKFPSIWYRLFEEEKFFATILTVCEYSDRLINQISLSEDLREYILSGKIFQSIEDSIEFKKYDYDELKLLDISLSINFLSKKISSEDISLQISKFFDNAIRLSATEILDSYSIPKASVCIIALGSYGNREMNLASDLDLIFIYDSTNEILTENFQKCCVDILNDVREKFSRRDFFQIDSRLRPEGKSSQIAWELNEFLSYIKNRMRIWEFQAYTKARLIAGSEELFEKQKLQLQTQIKNFIRQNISLSIKQNLSNIKSSAIIPAKGSIDLKLNNGGMLDIQFLTQYLILISGRLEFGESEPTLQTLKKLKNYKLVSEDDYLILSRNYKILKSCSILIYFVFNRKKPLLNSGDRENDLIKKYFKLQKNTNVIDYFQNLLSENNEIITKYYDKNL